ncbi:MAG: phosphodiesterase [Tabrizicola sp.]|uniref:phosphodiesterase n=1 Tax=Tabrizicola sp. TaxID=2005166 RepID=UPI002ABC2451|nr:phosphodiesterase [Tabrizicola sp.]MDZ4087054.1 phosphodiesterase [Tabrizicola sp.]
MLIAHLSDPHLCPPGALYQSVLDPAPRFARALAQASSFRPDLLILSGDLTEHGDAASYAHARDLLAALPCPVLAIPGNHDDREAFRAGLSGLPNLVPLPATGPLHAIAEGVVRVIGLDVTVPGDHRGQVTPDHAAWLDATLRSAPDTPTLLVMHQPPFVTGIGYVDAYRCFGDTLLAQVLSDHPQVIRLLAGHVHRFTLTSFAGRPALTAPATATSLALRLAPGAKPASFTEPPAMLLHLWRDGGLVSHLQAVGKFPGPHPFF